MSTIEEFKNAPIGATATSPYGHIAFKTGRLKFPWSIGDSRGTHLGDLCSAEMVGYTLNPAAPTTAQEALALAWDLAHPVQEWQVIPKGTRYLEKRNNGLIAECTAERLIALSHGMRNSVRTQDPLPDPEPDWLNAPAVKARVKGYHILFTWVPVDGPRHHRWYSQVKGEGETYDWQDLCDVTPLYPEGKKE